MPAWPWPDDQITRRSRVAHMYRAALASADPTGCAELDEAMRSYGQAWIIDGVPVDPDTLMTVAELAEVADLTPNAVRNWVARWGLARRGANDAGHALYRWGDVLEHQARRNRGYHRAQADAALNPTRL